MVRTMAAEGSTVLVTKGQLASSTRNAPVRPRPYGHSWFPLKQKANRFFFTAIVFLHFLFEN